MKNDSIDDIILVFETYGKQIKKLKKGQQIIVECPLCKGKMIISKSDYNGHLHIMCENKDFMLMQ